MNDENRIPSWEERLAGCPIHQWANIDVLLQEKLVPSHLHRPFHELLLARGIFPKNMSDKQGKVFGKAAVKITEIYELVPTEAYALKEIFADLISRWIGSGSELN